jgi:glycerophosphoryl diester phosphodiesterase
MIIGHRGAGKLAPENSLESLKLAHELRLHAVEIDVQLTKDKKFVLCHDGTFEHGGKQVSIADSTQKALMRKGRISLEQALDASKDLITIIDIKNWDSAQYLIPLLASRKQVIRFTGTHVPDIEYCKQTAPKLFAYISENKNPWRAIKRADQINADGLSLKWFIINPLTYWQAKRRGVEIMLYTLNSRLLCRLLAVLYPQVSICTDRPDRLVGKRYNW